MMTDDDDDHDDDGMLNSTLLMKGHQRSCHHDVDGLTSWTKASKQSFSDPVSIGTKP